MVAGDTALGGKYSNGGGGNGTQIPDADYVLPQAWPSKDRLHGVDRDGIRSERFVSVAESDEQGGRGKTPSPHRFQEVEVKNGTTLGGIISHI